MVDLLKVFKCATLAEVKNLYKAIGQLSTNEVRTVDGLKEYMPEKTVGAMIKRAKL